MKRLLIQKEAKTTSLGEFYSTKESNVGILYPNGSKGMLVFLGEAYKYGVVKEHNGSLYITNFELNLDQMLPKLIQKLDHKLYTFKSIKKLTKWFNK